MKKSLVIFGTSNILSDIFDCAIANHLSVAKVVLHLPEEVGERDRTLADRFMIGQCCKAFCHRLCNAKATT